MPDPVQGFSERRIETLRAKSGQIQTDHMDTAKGYRGFGVRVSRAGSKNWFYFFQWGGRRARLTLGGYPAVSLKEARARVDEAKACIAAVPPVDPRDHFAAKKSEANTVGWLVEEYLEIYVRGLRKLRTADGIERMMKKDVVPTIGRIQLAALHRKDISRVIERMQARGSPGASVRLYSMMASMFKWAAKRGDFEHNPMEKMERPEFEETERDRVLSGPEIKSVWNESESKFEDKSRAKTYAGILRLCLAMAGRIGEISGMTRNELDLKSNVWTLPASRSKNKKTHKLPLSSLALEIINEALADAGRSQFVFPTPRGDAPTVGNSVVNAVVGLHKKLGIGHFTTHDMRRSAATHMAKVPLKVNPLVLGWILNHRTVTRPSKVSRSYLHTTFEDYEADMRAALDAWADRLRSFVA